jgi:hypothetical protein
MTDIRASIESANFKQEPGGYIFRARSPWFFGPARYYPVSEAQKDDIVAILTSKRSFDWRVVSASVLVTTIALLMLSQAAVLLPIDFMHGNLTVGRICVAVGQGMIPVFLGLQTFFWLEGRRLRPILAGLPRTNKSFTPRDQFDSMGKEIANTTFTLDGWNQIKGLQATFAAIEKEDDVLGKKNASPKLNSDQ